MLNKPPAVEKIDLSSPDALKTNNDFIDLVAAAYDEGKAARAVDRDNRKYLRTCYENEKSVDYYGLASNDEDERRLFRSGLVQNKIDALVALLLANRPRVFLNPILKEDGQNTFKEAMILAGYGDLFKPPQPDPATGDALPPDFSEADPKYAWIVPALKMAGSFDAFMNEQADATIDDWWERSSFQETMEVLCKDSFIDSEAHLKWRTKNKRIVAEAVRYDSVYPDPTATIPEDLDYVIFEKCMRAETVEKRYGASDIEPNKSVSELWNSRIQADEKSYKTKNVMLCEMYLRTDYEDEKGGVKYPNGLIVAFVLEQGTSWRKGCRILRIQKNEYSAFPLSTYIPKPKTRTKGLSIANNLAPLQETDDKTIQRSVRNQELVGNPKIVYDPSGLIFPEQLSNKMAEKVPVSDMSGIKYVAGLQVSGEAFQTHAILQQHARDVSGVQEVAEGRTHGRIESSKAIIATDDIISRQLRLPLRNLECFLKRSFVIFGEMLLATHTKDMPIRTGTGMRTVRHLPLNFGSLIAGWEVAIGSDTELAMDPQTHANLMLTLAQTPAEDGLPMVTRKAALQALKIPNYDAVMSEMDQMAKMKANLQRAIEQMQQMAGTMQKLQEQDQALQAENAQLKTAIQTEQIKMQGVIEKTKVQRDGINQTTALQAQLEQQKLILEKILEGSRVVGNPSAGTPAALINSEGQNEAGAYEPDQTPPGMPEMEAGAAEPGEIPGGLLN